MAILGREIGEPGWGQEGLRRREEHFRGMISMNPRRPLLPTWTFAGQRPGMRAKGTVSERAAILSLYQRGVGRA